MKPYSQDLRDRILQALQARQNTQRAIAARFCVSRSFVEQLWQRWRHSGSSAATPHAGGRQRRLQAHLDLLRCEVAQQSDATLEEWRDRVAATQGPQVSVATICRALQRLHLPVKKVTLRLGAGHRAGPDAPRRVPGGSPSLRRPPAEVRG